eukprot:2014122-Amphidinium_carterae.1
MAKYENDAQSLVLKCRKFRCTTPAKTTDQMQLHNEHKHVTRYSRRFPNDFNLKLEPLEETL